MVVATNHMGRNGFRHQLQGRPVNMAAWPICCGQRRCVPNNSFPSWISITRPNTVKLRANRGDNMTRFCGSKTVEEDWKGKPS